MVEPNTEPGENLVWRRYIEEVADLVFALDAAGKIAFVNRAVSETTGYTAEELLGNSPLEFIRPESHPLIECSLRRLLNGEDADRVEVEVLSKDRRHIMLEVRGRPLFDKGHVVGALQIARDITERKRIEKALRESEERYRLLFEESPVGIGLASLDGKVITANKRMQTITGYSLEELKRINLVDTYENPADRKRFLESLRTGSVAHYPARLRRKDGTPYDALLTTSRIHMGDGDLLQTTCIDVTEHRKAEEALRRSEEKFRSLVEDTAAPVGVTDLTGHLTYVNRAFADLMNYSIQELTGQPFLDHIHPEDRDKVLGLFLQGVSSPTEPQDVEFRAIRKDGGILSLSTRPTRLTTQGELAGFVSIITDYTQRKLAEQQLRLQSEIAENMFEGVVLTRASDGVIVYANPRFEEMLGYGSGELIGENIATVNAPTDEKSPEDIAREIQTSLKQYGGWTGEVRNIRKDGTAIWCRANVSTLDSFEHGTIWVDTHEDITERKRLEEEIRKLSGAVEQSPSIIMITNTRGEIEYVNRKFTELSGYSQQEAMGMTADRLGEQPDEAEKLMWETIRSGKEWRGEFRNRKKNGELYWESASISPIVNSQGVIAHYVKVAEDITERRRAEEVSSRLAAIVESSDDAIIGKTLDGVITSWNQGAERLYGYSAEEVKGRPVSILLPPDRPDELTQILARVKRGERVQRYETQRMRKDGEIIDVSLTVSAIMDPTGRIVGASTIARDITERKQVLEKLRESEERFRGIAERSFDVIFTMDPEGRITYVSPAVERVLGYKPEEAVGQSIQNYLLESEIPKALQSLGEALEGRVPEHLEFEVRRKDGSLASTWISASPIVSDGVVIGAQAILRDITERKRAEEALSESEDRLRRITDNMLDMVVETDLQGVCKYASPSSKAILGYEPSELVGKSLFDFVHLEDLAKVTGSVRRAVSTGRLWTGGRFECRYRHADGHYVWLENLGNIIYDEKGQTIGGVIGARDITERKRAEDALRRRAEELATLQATVLDITGSHDLPKLLQTIVERAVQLLGATGGGMYVCNTGEKKVRCVVSYNTPYDYRGVELKYGEGAAGRVAETGRPLMVDDYPSWEGRAPEYEKDKSVTAVLSAPMMWQGQVTGVIHLTEQSKTRRFTQADQELLMLFASHAAIAIENARLLEQEKRHAEELTRYSTNLEQIVLERTGKLAESERKFRELADLLPQIVFEIDVKGDFTFVNRVAFVTMGYTRKELREGLNALRMFVPEDRSRVMDNMNRILGGEKLPAREYTALRKDGTTFPALIQSSPIVQSRKPVGLRGIVTDITDRRRMEEEVRAVKERLEYVVSANPAVIYTGRPRADFSDFDATYMSRRVSELTGFEPKDFIGHPEVWYDRVFPDDLSRYYAELPLLWKEGQHAFEYRFLHKDGTCRWIREEAKVIRDGSGKPVEVMGYWSDITAEKQAEAVLKESERRFRQLVENSPVAMAVLFGLQEEEIMLVNKKFTELFGYTIQDVPDLAHWWPLAFPDEKYREEIKATWTGRAEQAVREQREMEPMEATITCKDGSLRHIEVHMSSIGDRNVASLVDLTERKRIEDMRDSFVSAVTHELRTPLISIKGYLEFVLSGRSGPVSREVESNLEVVKRNTDRLASLTDDLLDIRRLQSGKLQVNLEPIDFRTIIEHATSEIKPFMNEKQERFKVAVPRKPLLILGDPVRLSQVLMNLLSNASKFTPEGGEVRLTVKDAKEMIVVKVTDTGIGIRKEDLGRVFEPFASIKKPSHIKGTGLGLSVTKGLVEAHTGKIWAESPGEGKGSTFVFALPKRVVK